VDELLNVRLARQLAERINLKRAQLDQHRPLSLDVLRYLHDDLRVVLTYHSNAIEGNTLNLRETRLVIEEGLTIGGHTLREHLETANHAQAFDYLEQLAQGNAPLDATAVLSLHRLVMKELVAQAGQLRSLAVQIRGSNWTPPPARQVPQLLNEWLTWLAGAGLAYPAIERAAIAHVQFEAIHPFMDGNGRTGRLLLNLMLLSEGYPPAVLLRQWRGDYLAALEAAQVHGKYRAIINLVGRAVEEGLEIYLGAVDEAAEPLLPLTELAAEFGYDLNYLGRLAREGRLAATKRAGRWYARRRAIADYKAQAAVEPRGRPRTRRS